MDQYKPVHLQFLKPTLFGAVNYTEGEIVEDVPFHLAERICLTGRAQMVEYEDEVNTDTHKEVSTQETSKEATRETATVAGLPEAAVLPDVEPKAKPTPPRATGKPNKPKPPTID
jgi:hypothetical protein